MGLVTDPLLFTGVAVLIGVTVLVTTPTKLVTGFLGGRTFDLDIRRSTRVALGMTTRGEFSLIIAALAISGASAGTLSPDLATAINAFAVGYVLLMAIVGTSLMQYSTPFERLAVSLLDGTTPEADSEQ
ncbi:MAG: CPA2 family monovalent cation:H+ antiporter-2 [Natronomonas sp.]